MLPRLPALLASSWLAVSPAGAQAPALAERAYSLDDALRLIRNDPRLQSAEQGVVIADARVTEARMRFLPELGLQASASKFDARYPFSLSQDSRNILLFPNTPDNIYSGRAYFNLPLYEGKRTLNTLRLALAGQKQALANRDSVRMDLILQVKEAYYRLLLAQERSEAADEALRESEKAGGGAPGGPWEAVEAESALAAARARSSAAAHELGEARLAFLKSLKLELDTPFRLTGTLATEPVKIETERAVLWAMELRPELRSQTYRAQMDSIEVNLAQGRRYPTVFLAGDYEVTDQSYPLRKNNWDVTVGVKIPFTYDLWSQLKLKRAEQRQGQLARSDLQDRVRLEVRQSAEGLAHWQEEWRRRERQWQRVQDLYDAAAAGRPGSPLQMLRARVGLLESRLAYLEAATEHLLARARLERAMGRELAP